MTRPTEKRNEEGTQAKQPMSPQPQEQMELAYQAHTLAQMLYGHLSVSNPWAACSSVWPASPQMHTPVHWMQGVDPAAGGAGWMGGTVPTWPSPQPPVLGPFMNVGFGPFPR